MSCSEILRQVIGPPSQISNKLKFPMKTSMLRLHQRSESLSRRQVPCWRATKRLTKRLSKRLSTSKRVEDVLTKGCSNRLLRAKRRRLCSKNQREKIKGKRGKGKP